jgi:hypothetical protein
MSAAGVVPRGHSVHHASIAEADPKQRLPAPGAPGATDPSRTIDGASSWQCAPDIDQMAAVFASLADHHPVDRCRKTG